MNTEETRGEDLPFRKCAEQYSSVHSLTLNPTVPETSEGDKEPNGQWARNLTTNA